MLESIVMVTELADNPGGTSITNRVETLAMQVFREFKLWPAFTHWIEHYPPDAPYDETFADVSFTLDPQKELTRPQWRALTREAVERLIGESLPDAPRPAGRDRRGMAGTRVRIARNDDDGRYRWQ